MVGSCLRQFHLGKTFDRNPRRRPSAAAILTETFSVLEGFSGLTSPYCSTEQGQRLLVLTLSFLRQFSTPLTSVQDWLAELISGVF